MTPHRKPSLKERLRGWRLDLSEFITEGPCRYPILAILGWLCLIGALIQWLHS